MERKSAATNNETISILTSYAFCKVSEYYADKGKSCILDEYHTQIIEYFISNEMDIEIFYNSMITKSEFVANMIQYIDSENGTENEDNYTLQTAIKKLYMILQFSQHSAFNKRRSHSFKQESISREQTDFDQDINNVQQTESVIKRRLSTRDSMVIDLAESTSKLLTLQEQADILKDVADEQQKKLIQIEEKEEEYKETVNELQEQLNSEKSRVFQINKVNEELQDELNENKEKMLTVNRRLSHKMNKLEDENEKLKKLINTLSMRKTNDLGNDYKTSSSEMKSTSNHIENTVYDGNGINLKKNIKTPSLSISNDTRMVTVNLPSSNITKSNQLMEKDKLLILNKEHIANLSKFYQTMDVDEIQRENNKKNNNMRKNKKKMNFWERLFDDFQCVPSWT